VLLLTAKAAGSTSTDSFPKKKKTKILVAKLTLRRRPLQPKKAQKMQI
jgi:hypothetical protein